jgi:hypothetical protein
MAVITLPLLVLRPLWEHLVVQTDWHDISLTLF